MRLLMKPVMRGIRAGLNTGIAITSWYQSRGLPFSASFGVMRIQGWMMLSAR